MSTNDLATGADVPAPSAPSSAPASGPWTGPTAAEPATPEAAAHEVKALKLNTGFMDAFMNQRHPFHQDAKQHLTRLHEIRGGAGQRDDVVTVNVAAAQAEIDRLNMDQKFHEAFINPAHPEYKQARDRMQRLQEIANASDMVVAEKAREARAEIAKLKNDPQFMRKFTTPLHPQHRECVQRMQDLHAIANALTYDPADPLAKPEADEDEERSPDQPPKTPDGYRVDQAIVLPHVPAQEAEEERMLVRGWAHELGFSQPQLDIAIMDFNRLAPAMAKVAGDDAARNELITAGGQACRDQLERWWGEKTDTKLEIAKGIFRALGPQAQEWLELTGMGNSASLIRFVYDAAVRAGKVK